MRIISLPASFLITAVIICNEVPDFGPDIDVRKRNLLSLFGVKNGYLLYGIVVLFSLLTVFLNIICGILPFYAILTGAVYFLGVRAFVNLKKGLSDTNKLIQASRFTVIQHSLVGIAIILTLLTP